MTPDELRADELREEELRAAGRELPHHQPDAGRREAMRASLLEAARATPPRRRRVPVAVAAGAGALLSAAALLLWWSARAQDETVAAGQPRATIQSSSGAHFEHTRQRVARASSGPVVDEVVRLRDGRVAVAVEHLRRDERFRLVTGDAEVEVRGTAFDVVVEGDQLVEVAVSSGAVDVRPRGRPPVALEAGERWRADQVALSTRAGADARASAAAGGATSSTPVTGSPGAAMDSIGPATGSPPGAAMDSTGTAATTPSRPAERPRRGTSSATRASRPVETARIEPEKPEKPEPDKPEPDKPEPEESAPPAPPQPTPCEVAFGHGFRALRAGNHGEAAAQFQLAVDQTPACALAADARYWRAVALARAGASGEARDVLADFLARHPGHARAGEASAMLGWLLLESGDRPGAARLFRAALRDPDAAVRESARKGLTTLDR